MILNELLAFLRLPNGSSEVRIRVITRPEGNYYDGPISSVTRVGDVVTIMGKAADA